MRKEFNYYDFKKFANTRLHRLKEERLSQYEKYVRAHFGRLDEDNKEELFHIGKHYGLNPERMAVDEKVVYDNQKFDYFVHDDNQFIALNKDMIIANTGDFDNNKLISMKVVSEDAQSDYDRMKDHIYTQREKRALVNMKYKQSDPEKYNKLEKAATDDFLRQLKDLKQFAKDNL